MAWREHSRAHSTSQGRPMRPSVALACGPSCCNPQRHLNTQASEHRLPLSCGWPGESTDGVCLLVQYLLLWEGFLDSHACDTGLTITVYRYRLLPLCFPRGPP